MEEFTYRVERLERMIGEMSKLEKFNQTLGDSTNKLERKMDHLSMTHASNQFVEKCESFRPFLEVSDIKRRFMNTREQVASILTNEEQIRETGELLAEIKELQRYLEFDPVHDLPAKIRRLNPLEKGLQEVLLESARNTTQLDALIQDYNSLTEQISEQCEKINKGN